MSGINEARERLTEMANDYLPPATGWSRARDDLRALLADHARLNELLGSSEQLAPAIDLEQFRRLAYGWVVEAGGVAADVKHACADELLALIDGQVQRDDERMVASPDISFDEFRAWMRGEQPTKGEGE